MSKLRRRETSARKKWENACNGRRMDSVQEDTPFYHGSHSDQRAKSCNFTSRAPTQTVEKKKRLIQMTT